MKRELHHLGNLTKLEFAYLNESGEQCKYLLVLQENMSRISFAKMSR